MVDADSNVDDEIKKPSPPVDLFSSLEIFSKISIPRIEIQSLCINLNLYSNSIFSSILKSPSEIQKIIDVENRRIWRLCTDLTLLIFQKVDSKTICDLLLVCRFFLEIGDSQEISRKIFDAKHTVKIRYQQNFFPEVTPQRNILDYLGKEFIPSSFNPCINYMKQPELRSEDVQYEQPGNGMNGFIFTKTS